MIKRGYNFIQSTERCILQYQLWQAPNNLFEFGMSKHKIIHKHYEQRAQRCGGFFSRNDSSSEEESMELQEVDCNNFFNQTSQQYSLMDDLDHQNQIHTQEEEEYQLEAQDYHCQYMLNNFDLERINARYMALMAGSAEGRAEKGTGSHVHFDGQIRIKFFSEDQPAAQVCDAEQYTSFEQYQQTQDEERRE